MSNTSRHSQVCNRNAVVLAQHRIDSGYYRSPAVIDETVRRVHASLLDELIAAEAAEQAEYDRLSDGEKYDGLS